MNPELQQPASEDGLSLFQHESEGSSPSPAVAIPGVVSLDRIVDASPLQFVEGIAVVQALCAALKDKAGVHAGMPDLRGVFLNESGQIVALTPPGTEPAANELARLLHRLVPAESTPPVARLFIDRWTSGASTDLGAFSSEIAYFARPNGRELLSALHARSAATPGAHPQPIIPPSVIPFRQFEKVKTEEAEKPAPPVRVGWLESHKRHIFAVGATVIATVVATGVVAWFSPSKMAEASQPPATTTSAAAPSDTAGDAKSAPPGGKPLTTRPASQPGPASQRSVARPGPRNSPSSASVSSPTPPASEPERGPEQTPAPSPVADSAPRPALPSRALQDMRIYSGADPGIEPPKLRSAGIREGLIAGFPFKTNSVEVVVDKQGHVERVRMQGPPQRIPDIMLLSRMKEWWFEPATKDGTPVRYTLVLSWNVTP